jgi:hypothetical protein
MPTHKSNDYKLTAVQYYLVEDKTQEEICKIFKCTPISVGLFIKCRKSNIIRNSYFQRSSNFFLKMAFQKNALLVMEDILHLFSFKTPIITPFLI